MISLENKIKSSIISSMSYIHYAKILLQNNTKNFTL